MRGQMANLSTELVLQNWRAGSTQAERLCAEILHMEGFSEVDPQHPLGGPDGKKDIVCWRGVTKYIAGVYFPPTPPSEADVRKKFEADYAGVPRNEATGFVFFVNQHLTIGQRSSLQSVALSNRHKISLYHLERIRAILDSPRGCGARLAYLKIAMSEEEQWAFWNSERQDLSRRLSEIEARQQADISVLRSALFALINRTQAMRLMQKPP